MPTPRSRLGSAGEARARRFLEEKGYGFVECNWHCHAGEIDLVMRDGEELVFVEVKLRRGDGFGEADEGITLGKARKLLAAGTIYVDTHPELQDPVWRFDVVAISLASSGRVQETTHLVNAVLTG